MDPVSHADPSTGQVEVKSRSSAPINDLPEEILFRTFSYLRLSELSVCALTCKKWHQVAHDDSLPLKILSELEKNNGYIGPETLKRYIGEIGDVPPLTGEILKELESPDPENKEKKKKETHILALIPETMNKTELTLNSLNELVQKPKEGGNATKYLKYRKEIKEKYGDNPYSNTSWVLMTKDVLNGSSGKTRENQLRMASEHGKDYRAPTLLEAAFINAMLFVSKEIRLFGNAPWIYTCCQDEPIRELKFVVGGFAPSGFDVDNCCENYDVGVAALRKF